MKDFCRRLPLLALPLWLACGGAHALNVDCAKIANADENTICSEVSIAKLDKDLANTYQLLNANLSLKMRDYLRDSQSRWLASSDGPRSGSCKGDRRCITRKYTDRKAYLTNPNFRYEGLYVGKSLRLTVQSLAGGALRVRFVGADAAAPPVLDFDENRGLRIVDRVMALPPAAENCALRVEFSEGLATVQAKEAKKKACDGVKGIAGAYAREYAAVLGK